MEMQTFGRRPVPERTGRLLRTDDRDYGLTGPSVMRVGQNYELARGVPDRSHLGGDMGLRSVSASSGYGTREDCSSCEDIALRTLPGAVGWNGRGGDTDYPYNPQELHFERNGNYYSTVKPLITVVKPKPGMQGVRARISLPPSPTCEQDDNYNLSSKTPEYGKLEVNLGDMLERLQSDLVGLRDSLRGDMRDAEPLLNSSINATKAVKPEQTYEELEVTLVKRRAKSDYSKPKPPRGTFRQRLIQELGGLGKYGFKTALQPDANPCLRCLWIVLFICCLGALCFQLWDRVSLFTTNPTHVTVDKRYREELSFPAVTICSLNMFRLTKIVNLSLYPVAHALLHKEDTDWSDKQLSQIPSLNTSDFFHQVGHQKKDLIESCSWYGKECGPHNFTDVITDYGLCFVFQPKAEDKLVRRAGQNAGLSLLLNVEHYEYLFGRKSSVGVRVSVHEPGVLPEVEAKGVNVPVGSFTTVMIQKVTEHHKSSTLANCRPSTDKKYNRKSCLLHYERNMIMSKCNCSLTPYDKIKICDAKDYFKCIVTVKAKLNENQRFLTCPPHCDFTDYDITLSEAGLPVYAAEGRLQRLNRGGLLERNFQQARDIYHRSDKVLLDHDIKTLVRIIKDFNSTAKMISNMTEPFQDGSLQKAESTIAFGELKEALKLLNSTSDLHYDAFYQSRHVDFCSETVITHIKDNMDDILQAESVIEDIRNQQFRTANETLWKIRRKVERLVSRNDEWLSGKYSGFFVEVTNGIERFRQDMLNGYGRIYREFVESSDSYRENITLMLNLTNIIRDSLLDNYKLISNITAMFSPVMVRSDRGKLSEELVEKLTKFFREVKYLQETPLPKLFQKMKELVNSYTPRRKTIIELSQTLIKIGPYIDKIDEELTGFFSNVETTLTHLQSAILTLNKTLVDLTTQYTASLFQKTELAEKINDDRLKAKIASAESYLVELRTTVSGLLETGRKIFKLLKPIDYRLIDFEIMSEEVKNELIESLKFKILERIVESLNQDVEGQLSTLNDLQTELEDYHRGSRLNGKFYLNNFLQLEVYFPELAETIISHEETYGLIALACDIGSSLALYLGISLLTIFGLLDLVVRSLVGSGGTSRR